MQLTLNVALIKVGSRYLAFSKVGGMDIRGDSASKPAQAVRNLLFTLSGNGPKNDDAEIAVDLLIEGTTLDAELDREMNTPALTDGREGTQDGRPFDAQTEIDWSGSAGPERR